MNTENTAKKDERNLYLNNEDLDVAIQKYLSQLSFEKMELQSHVLPVIESQGWISKEAVFAKISSPYYNA